MTNSLRYESVPLGLNDYLNDVALGEMIDRVESSRAEVVAFQASHRVLLVPVDPPVPQVGGCFACLARRWQSIRHEEERDVLERGGEMIAVDPVCLAEEPLRSVINATINAIKPSWPTSPCGYTMVYKIELDTGRVGSQPLIADSGCPRCHPRKACPEDASQFRLEPRMKRNSQSSRSKSIHEYGIEPDAFANDVCGMLGSVAAHAFDSTSTAAVTGYQRVRGAHAHLHEFFWSGHADDFSSSELLAILEGLERHSGLLPRRHDPAVVASYASVQDRALDPRSVTLYPDEFYRHLPGHFTKFSVDMEIPWMWAWSLRDHQSLLVPQSFSYYLSTDPSISIVAECSNGCAIGGNREEATLFGLMELIERDAFLNAWYTKAPLPEIDVTSVQADDLRHMINRLAMQGYDVRAFDNRVDLPFPVVTAVAVRRDGGEGGLCYAAGAGFDPVDAFRGALCEIASYVPGFDQRVIGHKDLVDAMIADYRQCTELKHHALLHGSARMRWASDFLLNQERAPRTMDELFEDWNRVRPRSMDVSQDLAFVVDTLADKGFDTLVVDQTSPEQETINLVTVSTIVPGLIPIDFGWTMQRAPVMPRLRHAPVAAGWRDTPLAPEEVNAVPHPFP